MPDNIPLIFARRITSLTDARYFAAKEASFLSFNLEAGTDGYLDPVYMQAMREWVEGPAIIGEFHSPTPADHISEAARFYGLDGVLVTWSPDASLIQAAQVWVKLPVNTPDLTDIIAANAGSITGWILELTEAADTWPDYANLLHPVCQKHTVILQYDGSADAVNEVLRTIAPAGIALKGSDEEKVGLKSFDEVDAVLEVMMSDER